MLHTHFYHYQQRALDFLPVKIAVKRDQASLSKNFLKDLLKIKYYLGLSLFSEPFSLRKQTKGN